MPAQPDESDFVDTEFQRARGAGFRPQKNTPSRRPPTREELEQQAHETQRRLEELRRMQGRLEQERVALEEARRRRTEYHTGREEMVQHLTRGIGLLEESEFAARQSSEQMAQTLAELRNHLSRVQGLNDQAWSQEEYTVELTRALTALENARLEWNAARLKWPILYEPSKGSIPSAGEKSPPFPENLASLRFGQLCRIGLGITWPVALVVLLAAIAFAVAWFPRLP